jgi:predicted GIY-YIG superfamily endonuclease
MKDLQPSARTDANQARWLLDSQRIVYVLRSLGDSPHFYTGITGDVAGRLAAHNAGRVPHTASRRPWRLHVAIEFADTAAAIRFERYLKSGSGRAFAKRHFGG